METLCFCVYNIEINANAFAAHNIYEYDGYKNEGGYFCIASCFMIRRTALFLLGDKGEVLPNKSRIQPREPFSAICKTVKVSSNWQFDMRLILLAFFLFTAQFRNSEIALRVCTRTDGNIREKNNSCCSIYIIFSHKRVSIVAYKIERKKQREMCSNNKLFIIFAVRCKDYLS